MKNHTRPRTQESYNGESNPNEVGQPFQSPYYPNRMNVEIPQVSPGMGSPYQPNSFRPAQAMPQMMQHQQFPIETNPGQFYVLTSSFPGTGQYIQTGNMPAPFIPATQHVYPPQNRMPYRPPYNQPQPVFTAAAPPRFNQSQNPPQYFNYANGSQAPAPPQTQQPPPPAKRERKPLAIVDPNSGQEVVLTKEETAASLRNEQTASDTPKVDNAEQARAEFANAIAAKLGEGPTTIPDVIASAASQKNDQVESDLMVPPPFIDTSVPPPGKLNDVSRLNGDITPKAQEEPPAKETTEASPPPTVATPVPTPTPSPLVDKAPAPKQVPAEQPAAVVPSQVDLVPQEVPSEPEVTPQPEAKPEVKEEAVQEVEAVKPTLTEPVAETEEPQPEISTTTAPASPLPEENAQPSDFETPKPTGPKYQYKDGQWSPANPEGKKRYDSDFLRQIKDSPLSLVKPDVVPMEIAVVGGVAYKQSAPGNFGQRAKNQQPRFDPAAMDMFSPQYMRGGQQGGRQPVPQRPSQNRGANRPVINIQIAKQSVVLPKNENAWVPSAMAKTKESDTEEEKTKAMKKSVRSKLNKLTPQNFEKLSREIAAMDIDTECRLSDVIQIFFDKAVDEPIYAPKYAEVCKLMTSKEVPTTTGSKVNFRKLLIDRCQATFEKEKKDEEEINKRQKAIEEAESEDKKKELQIELDGQINKTKRITLGNIRFIGELYKLRMLTARIMNFCISKLIKSKDEEQLECLCKLVSTIGKTYEEEISAKVEAHEKSVQDARRAGQPLPATQQFTKLETYLEEMRKLSESKELSSRIRFMLLDVLDLKRSYWVPRREGEKPKTIEEIHKELETERMMKTLSLMEENSRPAPQNYPSQRRDRDMRDDRKKSRAEESGGWQTPSVRKSSSLISQDQSSFKPPTRTTQNVSGGEIKFGPSSSAWGRGSLGATVAQPVATAGRFAALQGDDDSGSGRQENVRLGPQLRPQPFRGAATKSMGPTAGALSEKQRAIDTARNFNSGRSRSQQASRENSLSRQASQTTPIAEHVAPSFPVASGLKGKPNLSEDEIEKKAKALIDEYLNTSDLKEAVTCVTEQFHDSNISNFIDQVIASVIEKKPRSRDEVGRLFHELIAKRHLSRDAFVNGFRNTLECAYDVLVDIPQLFENLAQIIVPALQQDALCLHAVRDMEKLVGEDVTTRGLLGAAVLAELVKSKDKETAVHAWQSSGLTWGSFGAVTSDNVEKLLSKDSIAFTKDTPGGQPSCDSAWCPERKEGRSKKPSMNSRSELARIFQDLSKEEATAWVDKNVPAEKRSSPAFVRDLVTVVTELCLEGKDTATSINQATFESWMEFLSKVIGNVQELEMQALYAIQAVGHSRQHPKALFTQIIDVVYEKEVISEQAFRTWKENPSPSEHEGHAICITALKQFFEWLYSAEEEEDENEKDE